MRTGFVWHERYMWQEVGGLFRGYGLEIEKYFQPGEGFFGPEPKRRIRNLLEVSGMLDRLTPILPRQATVAEIARVHVRGDRHDGGTALRAGQCGCGGSRSPSAWPMSF